MKLRTIRLENVRRFIDPVEIGGIGDGLNVFSAPNEHGKSTVFDALHTVFFKQRNSWDSRNIFLSRLSLRDEEERVRWR